MTPSDLTCRELVELVTDYFDGALSEEDRRRFELHLADCDGCHAYIEQMRRTLETLGTLEPEHLTPDAERELLALFRNWNRR